MQAARFPRIVTLLAFCALTMTPFVAPAQDEEAPVSEDTAAEPAISEEEASALRKELEQREAEQALARRQNCEQARARIAQVVDVPPRTVRRTLEDGTESRMTEEEYQAYLQELRDVEARDCD